MNERELGKSRFDVFLETIRESRKLMTLVLLTIIIFSLGWFDIELPYFNPFSGQKRFFLVGVTVSSIILYPFTKWFVNKVHTIDGAMVYEVNANPEEDDDPIERYQIGKEKLKEMMVSGKNPVIWTDVGGRTSYLADNVDLENSRIELTHHADLDARELMLYYDKVEEAKIKNNKRAKAWVMLQSKFERIIRDIEAQFWQNKTEESMRVTGIDAENMLESIREEVGLGEDGEEDNLTAQDIIDNSEVSIDVSEMLTDSNESSGGESE